MRTIDLLKFRERTLMAAIRSGMTLDEALAPQPGCCDVCGQALRNENIAQDSSSLSPKRDA